MKFAIVLVAVFGVALGSAVPSPFGLKEDIDDFINLLPKDEILGIVVDYLGYDEEVQGALTFIMSNDFKSLLTDIENMKEYQDFLEYTFENGLNLYYYINKIHKFLDMPPFEPPSSNIKSVRRGTGVRGLLDDIEAILPYDEIEKMYKDKVATSEAFRNLLDVMKDDEFKNIIEQLRANPRFQEVIELLKSQGVDIQLLIDLLNKIFGWGIES